MEKPKSNDAAGAATPSTTKGKPTPLWSKLLTVAVLAGVAVFAISLLPRGYSQDISLIGKGDRVMVLFQVPFTVDGQEAVDSMNALRSEYDGRVKFILADQKVEQGKKFAELYGVNSTAFVFFSPDGQIINTLYGGQTVEALRDNINKSFNF